MPFNGILALVLMGLQAFEQAARTVSRIGQTLQRGFEEGWTQAQWQQAALDERVRTDEADDATSQRLRELFEPSQGSSSNTE